MSKKQKGISIGIVGTGRFAQSFIPLFKGHPLTNRIALCDINKKRLNENSKKFSIAETYDSLDEICKSDIQALVIITQPWLHAPQAIQAMEAGKHVYTAVPIISSTKGSDDILDWCDKLINTCKKTGMYYMMGETSYYYPEVMYCRRQADKGTFGQFVLGEAQYFHDTDRGGLREIAKHRWGANWNMNKSGGVPMHYPSHSISAVVTVMDAHMTEVSAQGYVYPDDDWFRKDTIYANPFSNETALFRLSNGATARICEYRRIGYGCVNFSFYGTEGCFLSGPGGSLWVKGEGEKKTRTFLIDEKMRGPEAEAVLKHAVKLRSNVYGSHRGSHPFLVNEFLESINQERQPAINAWQTVRYCAPGAVAHKSALKDGELLKIPDWGDAPER